VIDELVLFDIPNYIEFIYKSNGIKIKPLHVKSWGFKLNYSLYIWGNNYMQGPIEVNIRNLQMDTGIRVHNSETGAPIVNLFSFNLDQGDSTIYLGENFFLKLIADVVNFSFKPSSFLSDLLVVPGFELLFNYFLEPIFFHSGEIIIHIDILGIGSVEYDLDFGLPLSPKVTEDAIELFVNGGTYIMDEKSYASVPETSLEFIKDKDIGFQVAISDFVVNMFIGAIIQTNFSNIMPFDFIFDNLDFHITTDMLAPIIPELSE
jgi:hypothetical protein